MVLSGWPLFFKVHQIQTETYFDTFCKGKGLNSKLLQNGLLGRFVVQNAFFSFLDSNISHDPDRHHLPNNAYYYVLLGTRLVKNETLKNIFKRLIKFYYFQQGRIFQHWSFGHHWKVCWGSGERDETIQANERWICQGLCPWEMEAHLNRNKIESNLSVPKIQGCHENALYKSFEMSPHIICLCASTKIPLGPA